MLISGEPYKWQFTVRCVDSHEKQVKGGGGGTFWGTVSKQVTVGFMQSQCPGCGAVLTASGVFLGHLTSNCKEGC